MKKILNTLSNLLVTLLMIFAVCMMAFTIFSVTTFDHADRDVMGFRFFIVMSDSMRASNIDAGDIVIVKEVDAATLQPGDIISYTSTVTESYGEIVTHQIRALTTDENGNPGFITFGTTTGTESTTGSTDTTAPLPTTGTTAAPVTPGGNDPNGIPTP